MTFEEQFPSLKFHLPLFVYIEDNSDRGYKIVSTHSEKLIMSYCLDKQKVREALDKHGGINNGKYSLLDIDGFLKELGL